MAISTSVLRTNSQDINGVLVGTKWNTLDLTYSIPTSASCYGSPYGQGEPQTDFKPLNASQIAAVHKIQSMVSSVTNLTFTEMQETSTSHAILRFATSDK